MSLWQSERYNPNQKIRSRRGKENGKVFLGGWMVSQDPSGSSGYTSVTTEAQGPSKLSNSIKFAEGMAMTCIKI